MAKEMKKWGYWLRGHEWDNPSASKGGVVYARDYGSARKKVSKEIKRLRMITKEHIQLNKPGRRSTLFTFRGMCLVPNKKR